MVMLRGVMQLEAAVMIALHRISDSLWRPSCGPIGQKVSPLSHAA